LNEPPIAPETAPDMAPDTALAAPPTHFLNEPLAEAPAAAPPLTTALTRFRKEGEESGDVPAPSALPWAPSALPWAPPALPWAPPAAPPMSRLNEFIQAESPWAAPWSAPWSAPW